MSGGPDPLYVRARTALLDAADALAEQFDAVVLVGAQAIYLHTGDTDFAAAEYTTDADFCVAPAGSPDPRRCSWRRSTRSPNAPGLVTESATRTRWMSYVSCRPLTWRRSRQAWRNLRTMS